MKLSLVIPCYNEARSLPVLIARCAEVVRAEPDCEIILVDNGSIDDTPETLARELAGRTGLRSIRVPVNIGYGNGILEGLRACDGEILGWTHADLQTDPLDVIKGYVIFKSHARPTGLLVKGRRHGRPFADTAFTLGMSIFESVLMGHAMQDINAQPTLFSRALYERWVDPPADFALDLYAYAEARAAGARVERFPVIFPPRLHGVSHWNVNWRAKLKFIRRTLDFSFRLRRRASTSKGAPS